MQDLDTITSSGSKCKVQHVSHHAQRGSQHNWRACAFRLTGCLSGLTSVPGIGAASSSRPRQCLPAVCMISRIKATVVCSRRETNSALLYTGSPQSTGMTAVDDLALVLCPCCVWLALPLLQSQLQPTTAAMHHLHRADGHRLILSLQCH